MGPVRVVWHEPSPQTDDENPFRSKAIPMSLCSRVVLKFAAPVCLVAASAITVGGEPAADQFATIDDSVRFVPSTQPEQPEPQKPPLSTPENVDTHRSFLDWQRLTDDWGGARPKLDDRGISFNGSFTGDAFHDYHGGADSGHTDFIHLTNVNLTLDMDRLAGLHGGTFFVNYQHSGGVDPSSNIGEFQPVSSIASDHRDQIGELWYEQKIGEAVRIKLGKIDANTEFDNSDYAGEFVNASGGMSPTLPGFTTYPDAAFGGLAEYRFGDALYIRGGVFDGASQAGKTTGDDGVHSLFGGPSDVLWAGEIGSNWTLAKLAGHAAVGVTYHTGSFDRFSGGTEDGAVGTYLVVEHQLYKEQPDNADDEQGLNGYVRVGIADASTSEARCHVGGGVTYAGFVPGRDEDMIGLAANYVFFSDAPAAGFADDELNIELFYKVQVTKFFTLKPDVQYIHNVGGDATLDDAFVAGVRVEVQF